MTEERVLSIPSYEMENEMERHLDCLGKIECNSLVTSNDHYFTPNVLTAHCCLRQWYEIQGMWMCFYMHALTGDDVLHNGDM